MRNKPCRKIVIVGGGTAGWLTAGILASRYTHAGENALCITLIESAQVATVGVGEGTWPSMKATLNAMGVSETEFIKQCDVSLKQGSKFVSWTENTEHSYYHPFSLPEAYGEFNLAPHWNKSDNQGSFSHSVSIQAALCDLNLAPKQISTPEYAFNANYGYHLDAIKFASFLKQHCTEKLGVLHVLGHVDKIISEDNGDIKSLLLDTTQEINADLFIDCSGHSSLLLSKHFGIRFNQVDQVLFNNSALAVQVPYTSPDEPILSHTLSTAQDAGWIWDIGLFSRRGVGYVYSSGHTTDEQAKQALQKYLGPLHSKQEIEPRKLTFQPGHREKFWHRNCVAIGLSAGFVEPLEASAIALIELSAKFVADQIPANRFAMDIIAKRFNAKLSESWADIMSFLKLHYVLSSRQGSDYWMDHYAKSSIPESLAESLEIWQHHAPWLLDTPKIDSLFPSASLQYVLYGMGFKNKPLHILTRSPQSETSRANELFNKNIKKTKQLASYLPSNRTLLEKVRTHGFLKV